MAVSAATISGCSTGRPSTSGTAVDGPVKIGTAKLGKLGEVLVTYNGWPLYTYTQDGSPDEDSGQNILLNGGYWWVLRADGKPER